MVITWTTFNATNKSTAWYGVETLSDVVYGRQTLFMDGGPLSRQLYIHRVYLSDLKPNTTYSECECQSF